MPDLTFTRIDAPPASPATAPASPPPAAGSGLTFTKIDEAKKPSPSIAERFGTGVLDPIYGGAQIGARMGPDEGGAAFTDPAEVAARRETVDTAVSRRAAATRDEGWFWRGLGNIAGSVALDPMTFMPGLGAGGALARIGAAAAGGAIGAEMQPVERTEHFWSEKQIQGIGGAVLGGAVGAIASPIASAVSRAGQARQPIEQRAADIIGRRLTEDASVGGPTAVEAIDAIVKGRAAGKPLVLADVGDEGVRALAGRITRAPGPARSMTRSFLQNRDAAAGERLGQDISTYIYGGPSMFRTTDALMQQRSQAARPLYQQAEALQSIWSPRLQQFIDNPDVKRGLARGYRLERLDALAEGRQFDPTQLGVDLDMEGNVFFKRVPNVRVLDMGKRGLDAMIADERDPLTGRLSALGRSLAGVRSAYVGIIDDLDTSGVYRSAREAWAGPSRSLDSMRWGRSIFNRPPEQSARDFAAMSPNDREFAKIGVADLLRERIGKTGFSGNEARAVIKNPYTREQIRAIFPDDAEFERFADSVMTEHQMAATETRLLRGSQTAERLSEDQENSRRLVSGAYMASHLMHGNIFGAVVHGWRLYRDLGRNPDPALNEAIAKILFNPAIEVTSPEVERMIAGPPSSKAASAIRTGAVAASPAVGAIWGEIAR